MKKITILLVSVVSAMMLFTACTNEEVTFTQKDYEATGEEVEAINIDVRDRAIEVSLSEDDRIHIAYFESEKEYYDISVSEDKVLTMAAAISKEWEDYIGSKSDDNYRKISLQIPDSILSALTLTTTNENITLSALSVQDDITLSVNGGNIVFDKLNVGNSLNLTGKNGNIKGSVVGGYDDFAITCEIKKGDSNLPEEKAGGEKTLNVTNNNGDINILLVQE